VTPGRYRSIVEARAASSFPDLGDLDAAVSRLSYADRFSALVAAEDCPVAAARWGGTMMLGRPVEFVPLFNLVQKEPTDETLD